MMGFVSGDDVENGESKSSVIDNSTTASTTSAAPPPQQQQQEEHRPTDQDQQSRERTNAGFDTISRDFANSGEGRGEEVDAMDVDEDGGAAKSAGNDPSLDSLQKDFKSAFHLCKSCKASLQLSLSYTVTGGVTKKKERKKKKKNVALKLLLTL